MVLVRFIDRLVMAIDALTDGEGRALRRTVGMVLLTAALLGILAFTAALAWPGALP